MEINITKAFHPENLYPEGNSKFKHVKLYCVLLGLNSGNATLILSIYGNT